MDHTVLFWATDLLAIFNFASLFEWYVVSLSLN